MIIFEVNVQHIKIRERRSNLSTRAPCLPEFNMMPRNMFIKILRFFNHFWTFFTLILVRRILLFNGNFSILDCRSFNFLIWYFNSFIFWKRLEFFIHKIGPISRSTLLFKVIILQMKFYPLSLLEYSKSYRTSKIFIVVICLNMGLELEFLL